MKKAFLCSVVLLFLGTSVFSQTTPGAQVFDGSVELMSHAIFVPKQVNGRFYQTQDAHTKSTFDMVSLNNGCRTNLCIYYGDRAGDNWDIFHIGGGAVDRTRMVRIGEYKWTDNFTVPYVEPWAALAPGETRAITFNTSGADGQDGANGQDGADGQDGANGGSGGVAQMKGGSVSERRRPRDDSHASLDRSVSESRRPKNADYAHASLDRQVSSTVKTADGKTRNDPYSPVLEAKLGYMYVVHVLDETRDYYLLVRVDELKRGERLVLSYKKLELP